MAFHLKFILRQNPQNLLNKNIQLVNTLPYNHFLMPVATLHKKYNDKIYLHSQTVIAVAPIAPIALATAWLALPGLAAATPLTYDLPEETATFRPGPGVEVAQANCAACHSTDYINVCAVSVPLILPLRIADLPVRRGVVSTSVSPGRAHFEGTLRCV